MNMYVRMAIRGRDPAIPCFYLGLAWKRFTYIPLGDTW